MTTRNIYELAQTWNNGAEVFTAFGLNVTDTASASGSLLMDLQVGGVTKLKVTKEGYLHVPDGDVSNLSICSLNDNEGIWFDNNKIFFTTVGVTRLGLQSDNSLLLKSDTALGWSSSTPEAAFGDAKLYRDAANTLALRNSTNAQAFNIYNTYTDASNYERVTLGWSGNIFSISPNANGTGSTRVIHLSGLPTSNPGPGILWNNAGTPAIGT